jgi:hypothetical protein
VKDCYLLPLISELFRRLQRSKYFTKMDLHWGFKNVRIKEGDEHKATFITPQGLFEPTVIQFGLCNVPSTFQRLVDKILKEEVNTGKVVIYVDDILIHTETKQENKELTRDVLKKLQKYRLFCRDTKFQFEKEEVDFLRVTIQKRRIMVSKSKVTAILEEKAPWTRKMLRRFLGMTNYHRKFIRGYLQITRPLHDLMKDFLYKWGPEAQDTFEKLKRAITSAPVLSLPADEGKFWLKTDAPRYAIGAILLQEQDRQYRTLGYASKSLTGTKLNYMTYDKEMLAVMRRLEEWRSLLIGAYEPF